MPNSYESGYFDGKLDRGTPWGNQKKDDLLRDMFNHHRLLSNSERGYLDGNQFGHLDILKKGVDFGANTIPKFTLPSGSDCFEYFVE